jgi:peptidoglycan/LPS O-acetylase OafA/YrhL
VIFFVLSGYVVAFASDRRDYTAHDYIVARLSRMYSVALPAIILSVLLYEFIGDQLPRGYDPDWHGWTLSLHITMSMLFLNEAWGAWLVPPLDGPFWSLSYEMAFYIMFGIWRFAPHPWRIAGILLVAAVFGPRITALFPMWLLGVACYHASKTQRLRPGFGWMLTTLTAAGIVCLGILSWDKGIFQADRGIATHSPMEIAEDYLLACLFGSHIVGFTRVASGFSWITKFGRPIRWAAGGTFSLYLFHYPILIAMLSLLPWPVESWMFRATLVLGTLGIVFALAELTERRRLLWRQMFDFLIGLISVRAGWLNQGVGTPPLPSAYSSPRVKPPGQA